MILEGKKVLVVDDDVDYLIQMELQLESLGIIVSKAESRAEAEEKLAESAPDLMICDLMMEEMDAGFVLSHNARKRYPEMPVIMVTAVSSETGMEFETKTLGERAWVKADVVLPKPIRMEQLQVEMRRLLER